MEKKKNISKIISIVLAILLITSLGYSIYDKFIKKEEAPNCPKCEEKECPTNECPSNDSTNNEAKATTTNSYQIFSANLKKSISSSKNEIVMWERCYVGWGEDTIQYDVTLNNKMELFLTFDSFPNPAYSNKFGKIKIASKVISFTIVESGPGSYQNVYFINENGSVGEAIPYELLEDYGNKDKLPVTNPISGYKNIVSIIDQGGEPAVIDINGNLFSMPRSAWD